MLIFWSGIGQPLSLLLKLNPAVTKLALYDIVHTPGVAADLSHVETKVQTARFHNQENLSERKYERWVKIDDILR
jgi:malate dehydrogenase